MEDIEKLDCALCKIITESNVCDTCELRHYNEAKYCAFCFFACECIANNHQFYLERKD